MLLFLFFFLGFMLWILTKDGFAIGNNSVIYIKEYKYLFNFLEMPFLTVIFLIGVILVLMGLFLNIFMKSKNGIWFSGIGTVLTVWMLLISAGFNDTAYYPSTYDLQSSLTISNSSSSEFTLRTMSYVSILVPFVLGYIVLVWKKMDSRKISSEELENSENHTY